MRYEAFGLSPVDYGVMNPTGEKFAFKSMSVFISIMMLVHRPWSRFINEFATQKKVWIVDMGLDHSRGGRTTSKRRRPHSWAGATWFLCSRPFQDRTIQYSYHICFYRYEPVPHDDFFETVSGSHYSYRICFYRYVPIRFSQRSKENLFGSRDLLAWVWNCFFFILTFTF